LYRFEVIADYCLNFGRKSATLLRGNVHCLSQAHWKARSGLPIRVNLTFLLGVTAEALRANIDRKSVFLKRRWSVSAKFLHSRGHPQTIFARTNRPVNALQPCR